LLLTLWSFVPRPAQLIIIRAVQRNRRIYRWLVFRHADLKERANGESSTLPPAELRYRVSSSSNADEFVAVGKKCATDIESVLTKVDLELTSFARILDFGCGCGRTLVHLKRLAPNAQFAGTDIDTKAIKWCREHLDFASFSLNKETPPLDYDPESFDFVYVISVFTHLDEDYQFRWLEELKRIAKPGGILLLTLHGSKNGRGFVFERSYEEGLFPDWYQNAYHSPDYVLENFGKYFEVLDYLPHAMNNSQDVVVLQKRSEKSP